MKKARRPQHASGASHSPLGGGGSSSTPQQQRHQRTALLESLDNLSDPRERLQACAAIASKFEPLDDDDAELVKKMRREIVNLGREGMFKGLIRCTNDIDPLVRATAVGALRNLAITGGDKSLTIMQQEDAWSAMCLLISRNAAILDEIELSGQREALSVMELMCEWSSAVAERRLSDSLPTINQLLHSSRDRQVIEACTKLLYTASEDNLLLAKALATTDEGRAIGSYLETLLNNFARPLVPNVEDALISSAYALGVLTNLACVSETSSLPSLIEKWLLLSIPILSESSLPVARLTEKIVADAVAYEEDVIDEEGNTKQESDSLRRYLDVVQAQALLFELWADVAKRAAEAKDQQDNSVKTEFWATVMLPLQKYSLLNITLVYTVSGLQESAPKSLTLAVSSLQESAAECATQVMEAVDSVDPALCREAFSRILAALTSTLPSERDRAVAYATLLAASVSNSNKNVILSDVEASQILRLFQESSIDEVRALMCGPIKSLCESNPSLFLPVIAPVLLDQMKKEKSLIVCCEIGDKLMDLFSEDDRQQLFDTLGGLEVFSGFVKTFDRRLTEGKRLEENPIDDEEEERLVGVRSNLVAFLEWRNNM